MADVFISYSRKDKPFVQRLHGALAKLNLDTWVDWEDIPLTAEWLKEIFAGIEAADTFVFIISPDSVASKTCNEEIAHAAKYNKRIVPIMHRDVADQDVPQPLRPINWIFFRESDDFDTKFKELIHALNTDLDWVRAHTRLLVRAIEWDNKARENSYLLRGKDLREAEEWQAQAATGKEPKPTPLQSEYILASRKSTTRQQRILQTSITVALFIAVVLALTAMFQADAANNARLIAQARQLAAQSELIRTQQPSLLPLSTLLSIESLTRRDTREGDQALRNDLGILPRLIASKTNSPERPAGGDLGISALAYSPDGRWLAMGDLAGTIRVWDTSTWTEKWKTFFSASGTVPGARMLAFSPNSRLLASARDNGTQVWDAVTGQFIASMNENDQVWSVAFSPDGRWVVSSAGEKTTVWNATTGNEVSHIDVPSDLVQFSPDGKLIAAGGGTKITVWEVATGKILTEKIQIEQSDETVSSAVSALVFSPNGEWIASGEGEISELFALPRIPIAGTILVWEAKTGKEIARIAHKEAIRTLAFSPDSQRLASGSYDSSARVWNVKTGQQISEFIQGYPVNSVAFANDGQWVISAGWDGMARVWEAETGREVARMTTESPAHIDAFAQTPNSSQIAIGNASGGVWVWELKSQESLKVKQDGSVSSIKFSPDGKSILTSGWDKTARVWDAATGREVHRVSDTERVPSAIYSPDGRYAASASLSGSVHIWDTRTNKEMAHLTSDEPVSQIAFSPDSRQLAIAYGSFPRSGWIIYKTGHSTDSSEIRLIDIASGREVMRLKHEGYVNSIAFTPDGKQLVSGSDDKTARVWDVSNGKEITRVYHKYRVNLVAVSPDGKWAASAESCFYVSFQKVPCNPVVQVWNPSNGKIAWQSIQNAPWIQDLVFSPDSRMLAIANNFVYSCPSTECDNLVRVWDVASGKDMGKMVHTGLAIAVSFSPDSRLIASGGGYGDLRIWNPVSGEVVSSFTTLEVWSIAFSPDNHSIAIGGYEKDDESFVRMFPLQSKDLIKEACSRLSRNLTMLEWRQYIGNEPYRPSCPNLPVPPPEPNLQANSQPEIQLQANGPAFYVDISAEGRYIVFDSSASNLVCGDTNRSTDIFLYDQQTKKTTRVSLAPHQGQSNDDSSKPSISADGRWILFTSRASNLVSQTGSLGPGLFLYDRVKNEIAAISPVIENVGGFLSVNNPAMSRDGRHIVFEGSAGNTSDHQVYIYDRDNKMTTQVSIATDGTSANSGARNARVSADGRFISFQSGASNLGSHLNQGREGVFVHDRNTRQTTLVSIGLDTRPVEGIMHSLISADGRYVTFATNARQILARDLQSQKTMLVSSGTDGMPANGDSIDPSISADGRYIAFASRATNLVNGDSNGVWDIFVFDWLTRQNERVSISSSGTEANKDSFRPTISSDGRYVAFQSEATNLTVTDTKGFANIFVRDRKNGITTLVSASVSCAK